MDIETLNNILWRIDPMGTCCAVNEGMEDEYLTEAREIAERLSRGEDPHSAVVAVFDQWFWDGCLLEAPRKARLELIMDELR